MAPSSTIAARRPALAAASSVVPLKKAEALKAYRRALVIHPFLEGAKKALQQIEPETEQKI